MIGITPSKDKDTIKAILDTDDYITNAGFSSENIRTTKASTNILSSSNPDLQIFISMGAGEGGSNENVKNVTYDISVSGKRALSNRIDSVVTHIIDLLHDKDIGRGHLLQLLDVPMELSSDPSIYVVEMTFLCQSII